MWGISEPTCADSLAGLRWVQLHSCLTPLCLHGFSPQASICRSSQPLSGFSARCLEDEQMLQAIRKANPGSDFIYVVDTRPKVGIAILMRVFAALDHEIGHKAKLLNDCHHPLGLLHLRRGCSSSQSQHLDALHGCFLGVLSSWLCQVLQIFPLPLHRPRSLYRFPISAHLSLPAG